MYEVQQRGGIKYEFYLHTLCGWALTNFSHTRSAWKTELEGTGASHIKKTGTLKKRNFSARVE